MNHTDLLEKLDIIEKRQKCILGNQVAILEMLNKDRETQTRWRAAFKYDPKPWLYAWCCVFACGLVLTMI